MISLFMHIDELRGGPCQFHEGPGLHEMELARDHYRMMRRPEILQAKDIQPSGADDRSG